MNELDTYDNCFNPLGTRQVLHNEDGNKRTAMWYSTAETISSKNCSDFKMIHKQSNLETIPDDLLLLGIPTLNLGVVGFFDGGSLDLLGRCQKSVFWQPVILDNDNELKLFMTVKLGVGGLQVGLKVGTQGFTTTLGGNGLLLRGLRELKDGERLWLGLSSDASKLDVLVDNEFVFNGSRSDIFTLGSLEDFLGTSSNLKTSLFIQASLVSGANISVSCESLSGSFRILEVTHHGTRCLNLNFTVLRNTAVDIVVSISNVSNPLHTRFGGVRIVEILSHTISFQKIKSQDTVPTQKVGRKGSTSGTSESNLRESKSLEKLLLDEDVQNRDA